MRRRGLALGALALVGACSSETKPAPPVPVSYSIVFPSVAAAVATDTLQVLAFDGNARDACQELVNKRLHKQELPPRLAETDAITPCELRDGRRAQVTVDLGRVALLAIGKRGRDDFLLGCALQAVSERAAPTTLALTVAFNPTGKDVPPTTCGRLSDKCDRKCGG